MAWIKSGGMARGGRELLTSRRSMSASELISLLLFSAGEAGSRSTSSRADGLSLLLSSSCSSSSSSSSSLSSSSDSELEIDAASSMNDLRDRLRWFVVFVRGGRVAVVAEELLERFDAVALDLDLVMPVGWAPGRFEIVVGGILDV